ncbi:hypothetical protein SK854_08360 [Lentzea sp. BCCO 10_0061]|uniref:Uncharacterized protein n=1 Tax=Lentzea sokolovensis TaxID=3095429 RepID=A0ABU4URK1_9PSEU|nr:hypothetical protein [Lentzea sp. BCCO 10_0061]MDX8142120.1 hypothetical protein [Lentzea sp. BCCO 10_0061]
MAGAALLGLAAPASAGIQEAPYCQNDRGIQTVVDTGPIKSISTGTRVGTIFLCKEGSLYFAFPYYYATMGANQTAQGWIKRYDNGSWVGELNCDQEPGGNQRIKLGERRCWTPNLNGDATRYTFRAVTEQYSGNNLIARGATAIGR